MNWLTALKKLLRFNRSSSSSPRRYKAGGTMGLEQLETRLVPYSATGNLWPNPQLITISFVPDGTLISTNGTRQVGSNLFATFNAKFGSAAAWQNIILKAAQTWAQQTNINFAVVSDNGVATGGGNYQQGDPNMGDIRIGGDNFGNSVLGMTYYPPSANNYSIAGNVAFNTGQLFNLGSTYDLFTVASHEIGHALGLGESSVPNSIEYANYNGIKKALACDDIAGIRNIYSSNNARTPDAFASASTPNTSFAAAANLNSYVSPTSLTAALPNLDITTTSEVEYYTFTAPTNTSGTLAVNVQSSGLSLLAPKVTVYAADQQTVLGSASALGNATGATLSVNVSNVTAGQQFYVKVQGTDKTAFSTGAYALTLNLGNGPSRTVSPPNTQVLNGNPLQGSGGYAQNSTVAVYLDTVPVITGISPDTGSSNCDGITSANQLTFFGVAPAGATVQLYQIDSNGTGQLLGTAIPTDNNWSFNYTSHTFNDGTYTFYATATTLMGLGTTSAPSTVFTVTVETVPPNAPVTTAFTLNPGATSTTSTTSITPTLFGTAEANCTLTVFINGQPIGTVAADSCGIWCFQPIGTVAAASFPTTWLGNSSITFTATAADLAGNVSMLSAPLPLTINTQNVLPPLIQGITPDNGTSNGAGVTNAAGIKVNGQTYSRGD